MSEVNFYSDIRMGSWGIPLHIGCINFSWSLFLEDYDYDKHTEYGCEITGQNVWLIENKNKYAIFDLEKSKYENISKSNYFYFPLSLAVSKSNCMDLYKNVMHNKHLIVGYTVDEFYNVYKEHNGKKQYDMMSFARKEIAEAYRDFLIRIPYDKYQTVETMRIEKLSIKGL